MFNEFKKEYGCTADNYLKNEYSICREERQYAVLLYNVLRYYRKPERRGTGEIKRIFKSCRIPAEAEIIQVFYEATFMRDFFERNRRIILGKYDEKKLMQKTFTPSEYKVDNEDSFNYKLIQYVHGYCSKEPNKNESLLFLDKERNLGRNEICTEISEYEKYIIRCMMEVKPDIAVIYMVKGEKYLLFLECKFGSAEAFYEGKAGQREIQWRIADFLCKYYLEAKVSDFMEQERSCLVKFVRSKREDIEIQKEIPPYVSICDLIEINKEIFHEDV